jgi:hypothetical protein
MHSSRTRLPVLYTGVTMEMSGVAFASMLQRYKETIPRILPYLFLMVMSLTATTIHMVEYRTFSPIDELRHLDYAIRVSHGDLPKLGDKLTQEAMKEEACRGIDLTGWADPPCDSPRFRPVDFRDDGWQTATPHPPTYYAIAGISARVLRKLSITGSLVDGARLVSGLFLAAGLMMTFFAGRLLGARTVPLVAALTLVPILQSVLHSSSIVTPDSVSILAGASLIAAVTLWKRNRLALKWLCVVAAGVGFTKITNILISTVVGLVLLFWSLRSQNDRCTRLNHLLAGVCVPISSFVAAFSWLTFDRLRATIDPSIVPQNIQLRYEGIPPLSHLLQPSVLLSWLPPIESYDLLKFTNFEVLSFRGLTINLLLGGILIAALRFHRENAISLLAGFTVLVAVFASPMFVAATAATSNVLVNPAGRYGLALLPVFVIAVASAVKGRVGTSALVIFSGIVYLIGIGAMITA